ncbi:MAG: sensor histidine kinase [Chloroflexota bacterium]
MVFSKRLSGLTGHILFLLPALWPLVALLARLDDPAFRADLRLTICLLILLGIVALVGTARWRRYQGLKKPALIVAYFAFQIGLIQTMILLESPYREGAASMALYIGLMVQISVLALRWRTALFFAILFFSIAFYLTSFSVPGGFPLKVILPMLLAFGFTDLVPLLFGSLIIGEERALQTGHQLGVTNRKLSLYAAEAEELATLRERNRLAREIHDNLGHYLTAVNMQIEVAMAVLPSDQERTLQALTKAQTLTKEGLSEIRRSISALRANPVENRALNEAILLLVEEHRAAGNGIEYEVLGDIRPCSAAVEMTLYRIAQEGLTNIRKHARATCADLNLDYKDARCIRLRLHDDGVGSSQPDGGFGLLGVRERVHLLGGTLSIQTAVGHGFTLQVELPT